jgi:hypothetical protein
MIELTENLLPLGEKDTKPCAAGARRSWMRGREPLARAVALRPQPLTQLRLASKLASLRNPLPQGERVEGLR